MIDSNEKIILDGSEIPSKDVFFQRFKSQLAEGTVCGSNLDALHDVLSTISVPTELIIIDEAALSQNLGDYWVKFFNMLIECLDENHNLILTFTA